MKLFKKKTSAEKLTSSKAEVTKLEKNQLEKVAGGAVEKLFSITGQPTPVGEAQPEKQFILISKKREANKASLFFEILFITFVKLYFLSKL